MAITFGSLLSKVMYALGDIGEAYWTKSTVFYWLVEAIREFPIPRPQLENYTVITDTHVLTLPADFRDLVWVEYPVGEEPPVHLTRRSHLESDFYDRAGYYDIDRDYSTGKGWTLWTSELIPAGAHVIKVNYLADHDTDMAEGSALTVPERYHNILMQYTIWRAWNEKLSLEIANPTAHTSTILQITETVAKAREKYDELIVDAVKSLSQSRVTHNRKMDKYDRIY
jgi:hypothetical protein